jgi:hypothetical protein
VSAADGDAVAIRALFSRRDENPHGLVGWEISDAVRSKCCCVCQLGVWAAIEQRCDSALSGGRDPGCRDVDTRQHDPPTPAEPVLQRVVRQVLEGLASRNEPVLLHDEVVEVHPVKVLRRQATYHSCNHRVDDQIAMSARDIRPLKAGCM